MKGTMLLKTPEEIRRQYDIIIKIIDASPIRRCIVEHAYDMISEPDLVRQVISCKSNNGAHARTRKDFDKEIEPLLEEVILNKGMIPGSDEWHYVASLFTKTVVDYAKKTDSKRHDHL